MEAEVGRAPPQDVKLSKQAYISIVFWLISSYQNVAQDFEKHP